MSSSKVGKLASGKAAAADVPLKGTGSTGTTGTASSPKQGRWGKLFRGDVYDERLRLEESLKLVVSNSASPPSGVCASFTGVEAKN